VDLHALRSTRRGAHAADALRAPDDQEHLQAAAAAERGRFSDCRRARRTRNEEVIAAERRSEGSILNRHQKISRALLRTILNTPVMLDGRRVGTARDLRPGAPNYEYLKRLFSEANNHALTELQRNRSPSYARAVRQVANTYEDRPLPPWLRKHVARIARRRPKNRRKK
jgi:hypothetical protein